MKEYQNLKESLSHLKIAKEWINLTNVDVQFELNACISNIKARMKLIECQEEE